MKAIIPSLITLASLLAACSNVSEDERLIYVEPAPVNTTVLVEEYSGQLCVNCPTGAAELEKLEEQYGDNLAVITYHGGLYAINPGEYEGVLGLGTDYGALMEKAYGINGKPCIVINALTTNNTVLTWATDVAAAFRRISDVSLSGEAIYDEASSSIQIQITGACNSVYDGDLQVVLTESGIVAPQMMPDNTSNNSYVHNNVFRATVNGETGEPFAVSVADIDGVSRSYTVYVEEEYKWNPANMRVVAYVINEKGVQQALSIPVRKLAEPSNDNN
ncbi:MAG: Omp28 family outer membrane lipoprotein [Prevotella sp.]